MTRISPVPSILALASTLACSPGLPPADSDTLSTETESSGVTGETDDTADTVDTDESEDTSPVSACEALTEVEFADPGLEQVVRATLELLEGPISPELLATLVEVHVDNDAFDQPQLRSLAGLECAINLERLTWKRGLSLDFEGLEPIGDLTSLRILELWGGQLDDLGPLAGLEQLELVSLRGQAITDLGPLAGLTKLEQLELRYNSDLAVLEPLTGPLAELDQLEELHVGGNAIVDVGPLQGLDSVTLLNLSANAITDVSAITTLPELTRLYAGDNQITDLTPLRELPQLETIELQANAITELDGLDAAPWQIPGGCADIHLEFNPLSELAVAEVYPQICASNPGVAISIGESELCNSSSSCDWPCTPDQPQPWPECP